MSSILTALLNVAAKNPTLLESLIEGLGQLLLQEIQKSVASGQAKS